MTSEWRTNAECEREWQRQELKNPLCLHPIEFAPTEFALTFSRCSLSWGTAQKKRRAKNRGAVRWQKAKEHLWENLTKSSFHPEGTRNMTAGLWFSAIDNIECKLLTCSQNIPNFVPQKPILRVLRDFKTYLATEMSLQKV